MSASKPIERFTMLSQQHHVVLWLDHLEARIIHLTAEPETVRIHPTNPPKHLHAHAGSAAGTHIAGEPEFYRRIAAELAGVDRILVAGAATAKNEFVTYLQKHAPDMAKRVAGVEASQRLTDPQLVAEAHKFFIASDRMEPQST